MIALTVVSSCAHQPGCSSVPSNVSVLWPRVLLRSGRSAGSGLQQANVAANGRTYSRSIGCRAQSSCSSSPRGRSCRLRDRSPNGGRPSRRGTYPRPNPAMAILLGLARRTGQQIEKASLSCVMVGLAISTCARSYCMRWAPSPKGVAPESVPLNATQTGCSDGGRGSHFPPGSRPGAQSAQALCLQSDRKYPSAVRLSQPESESR